MGPSILFSKTEAQVQQSLQRMRRDSAKPLRASIVIPVNAQKDLSRILLVASDLLAYKGAEPIEFILVVNNYPPETPPVEIEKYVSLGFNVLGIPKVNYRGGVAIAARIPGVELARSESLLLFDADCRIPDADALLNWYMTQLESGTDLAYTHVDYFDLPAGMSSKVRMFIHHTSRWVKRTILGIPTCRGSNYAIKRQLMLDLYAQGRLPYDIHVGPVIKSIGGKIAYSGAREMVVYTSGRFFSGGWKELVQYLIWRVGYYRRILTARSERTSSDK